MLLVIGLHVWRDMAQHKARTLRAVLSIAVGVFALGQVVRLYLAYALACAAWALLLAVRLAALCAHWMLDLGFNLAAAGAFQVSPVAALVQAAVGLIVPVRAALVPVFGGARVSPPLAISRRGTGNSAERGWRDGRRWFGRNR